LQQGSRYWKTPTPCSQEAGRGNIGCCLSGKIIKKGKNRKGRRAMKKERQVKAKNV
jgi:hypothetical protein